MIAGGKHPEPRHEIPVIATRRSPVWIRHPTWRHGSSRACAGRARRTFTVYTDVPRVTDAVVFHATDTVTVLLVDVDGRLRWRTTGPVSEHSGFELAAAIAAGASRDAGAAEWSSIEQFEFASTRSSVRSLCVFGVTSGTAHVTLTAHQLVARFGPWTCETAIGNVRDVCRTGPYHWYKAIGPAGRSSTAVSPLAQRLKGVSACCCANPYRASLPSARFVTPGSRSHSPSPNGSSRRCGDAQVGVNGHRRRVLVAGATGDIGRRLVAELVAGRPSRAMPDPHSRQARRRTLARGGRSRFSRVTSAGSPSPSMNNTPSSCSAAGSFRSSAPS